MTFPPSDIDLYSDDTLVNTAARYQALRALGPVVHVPANDLYAITQFRPVKAALRADDVLISGKGVAANEPMNSAANEATITSDGALHNHRRSILMRPLMPKALKDIQDRVEDTADRLVHDLVSRDGFCGVKDFASHLPLSIVAELVGLEEEGRGNMLSWAAATFDALGPMNERTSSAMQHALGLLQYAFQLRPQTVREGGWARAILDTSAEGTISPSEAAMMIIDYVAPSLDTTILASAHMLWRLAITPGAFEALKDDTTLIPSVVNESVRLASPIRSFTRFVQEDYRVEEATIPAGARVAILYASANWDEGHYENADDFVVGRNARDHVGWGHGPHVCAGQHLARLEMEALLKALLAQVTTISVEEPQPILNNVLQGFAALPARFH
ncbi:MAG: cytochrome P450 [Pseudomonadota bacterium]